MLQLKTSIEVCTQSHQNNGKLKGLIKCIEFVVQKNLSRFVNRDKRNYCTIQFNTPNIFFPTTKLPIALPITINSLRIVIIVT